ncbi:hypothetical protein HYH03_011352 [Edaphochlamys debaryana]|uniref:Protein kinase domain-containing protein n=1 Tax=Edaphochlamys debaryana TaxID=47281 RepID=A0A836BVN6_9CHLO|nr:hypothetical protein HYH03_011352 [Edaphochlamys debaryana]|eukprot:KAG2490227.1 hypothetical protein HYH03_011352 [Edaphochlamys debaryana]
MAAPPTEPLVVVEDATFQSSIQLDTAPSVAPATPTRGRHGPSPDSSKDCTSELAPEDAHKVEEVLVECHNDTSEPRTSGTGGPVSAPDAKSRLASRFGSWSTWKQRLWPIPLWFWAAVAVVVIIEVLAVTGSVYYINSVAESNRKSASDVAQQAARSIETVLDKLIAPMHAIGGLVVVDPNWERANASFPAYAQALYDINPFYQLELCPYGIVGAMSMPWLMAQGEERWQVYLSFDMFLDIMDPKRPAYQVELNAIVPNHTSVLLGPWFADGELSQGAFALRYSVWHQPGDWQDSMPMPNSIAACPPQYCVRSDGAVWWGWANAVFAFKHVRKALQPLDDNGLLYTMAPDRTAVNQSFLATSDKLPDPGDCEILTAEVYRIYTWTFCVQRPGGFQPAWAPGLLAGVTALALLLAVLVGLVLRSRDQVVRYLHTQLATNKALAAAKEEAEEAHRTIEAEKRVMDCLVQRQRNLIELFGKEEELLAAAAENSGGGGGVRRRLGLARRSAESSLSRESAAMDRIEQVRHQLTVKRSASRANLMGDDIKLMEQLGEGTFGKVYRGTWRGVEVAIKTMVLPKNMSGAEKREKMAVMEAAISSSLAHPNVVQTFTYYIKTVREEAQPPEEVIVPAGGVVVGGGGGSSTAYGSSKNFDEQPGTPSHASQSTVHGYEVRLVLEYCDGGSLRDALDGDAFLTAGGVNYRGVLDSAADIAKALLHLHAVDLIHGDLKARNVMLKSSGGAAEGRGVVCKVADFGLSLKMDRDEQTHMSGMYQGTLTHMAPELLLHGRMSKAADVYAYGITLWELFTAGTAFAGVPRALLGHQITQDHKRPAFPPFTPEAYVRLASDCWAPNPEERPTFEAVLSRLEEIRATEPGPAAPLARYAVGQGAGGAARLPTAGADAAVAAAAAAAEAVAASGMATGAMPFQRLSADAVAMSNPVYDTNTAGGTGVHVTASGGSGSGFASSFMRPSALRGGPVLDVVEEDDREGWSSRRLAAQPSPGHGPAGGFGRIGEGPCSGDPRLAAVREADGSGDGTEGGSSSGKIITMTGRNNWAQLHI